jgi:hypothetical protein
VNENLNLFTRLFYSLLILLDILEIKEGKNRWRCDEEMNRLDVEPYVKLFKAALSNGHQGNLHRHFETPLLRA